jgi:hypothetical protein
MGKFRGVHNGDESHEPADYRFRFSPLAGGVFRPLAVVAGMSKK